MKIVVHCLKAFFSDCREGWRYRNTAVPDIISKAVETPQVSPPPQAPSKTSAFLQKFRREKGSVKGKELIAELKMSRSAMKLIHMFHLNMLFSTMKKQQQLLVYSVWASIINSVPIMLLYFNVCLYIWCKPVYQNFTMLLCGVGISFLLFSSCFM